MVTRERFAQGMTVPQYLDRMKTNKEPFTRFLAEVAIRPEDKEALAGLGRKVNVMVITEDWCGDALYNVPVLAKLVDGLPNVELRVFLRDDNPDLMDQYLKHGRYRSIPVFAFFDDQMNELGRLVERPVRATGQSEEEMQQVRRSTRGDGLERRRQDVVAEVRTLLKA
jgi:thioredoxin family protein